MSRKFWQVLQKHAIGPLGSLIEANGPGLLSAMLIKIVTAFLSPVPSLADFGGENLGVGAGRRYSV